MTAVVYVAKRSIIAGHSASQEYGLNLRPTEGGLAPGRKVGAQTQRSISDRTETLYYFGKNTWSVSVLVMNSTERAALEEFLHSTEALESFTFSPYGTSASLGTTYAVRRTDGNYQLERMEFSGATPIDDAMRVTFSIEEA